MQPARTFSPRRQVFEDDKPFWLFRLETWLVVSLVALVFQLFPALFWNLLYIVDVRNWSWGIWVAAQIAVIVSLIALRTWQSSD